MIPKAVRIVEVAPRDGLQNEKKSVSVSARVGFIENLLKAGCQSIEAGSFVSQKWVPQMARTADVLDAIAHHTEASFPVLVPNERGFDDARAAGAKHVAIFAAASETFSQKNINCTIEDSLKRFSAIAERAKAEGITLRGYVSCVLGCPYEGTIDVTSVCRVAQDMFEMGCQEISLGDTIGVGTPERARRLIRRVAEVVPRRAIAVHFHDTYGQALANIHACLEEGIEVIDSSAAGLGGCPYAKGASGNVATEDVAYMLNGMNVKTGIDITKLAHASKDILIELGKETQSKAARAILSRDACI